MSREECRLLCCFAPLLRARAAGSNPPLEGEGGHRICSAFIARHSSGSRFASHDFKQHISFPRRDCARVVSWYPPRTEGWAERRQAHGCSGTRRACRVRRVSTRVSRGRPGACEAPCVPQRRDARLSALHLGDFRPRVRASVSGIASGDACSELLAARVIVPGGRFPRLPSLRLQAAAAGRQASLRLQDCLRRRPSMSKAMRLIHQMRCVVNINSSRSR